MKKILLPAIAVLAISLSFQSLTGCVVEDGDGENEVAISAECTWYAGVECEAACDEFDFWLSCEGEMDIECDPHCNEFEIDIDCSASCEADCGVECQGDWGSVDCEAYCQGQCEGNCEGECQADGNSGECSGHCEGYCEGHCSAGCEVEAPDIDCDGWCEASCEGECSAEANIDCHLCNADVYASCEGDMNIDCHAGCDVDGVLECNGEFIDRKDFEAAVDWVKANMPEVEVYADAEAECHGNSCSAEGSCGFECAVGAPGNRSARGLVLLSLLLGLFLVARKRK